MRTFLVRLLLVLAIAGVWFGTVGCETWKGAGKDVSHVGDKMSGD
jgi:predicted small secreted protein